MTLKETSTNNNQRRRRNELRKSKLITLLSLLLKNLQRPSKKILQNRLLGQRQQDPPKKLPSLWILLPLNLLLNQRQKMSRVLQRKLPKCNDPKMSAVPPTFNKLDVLMIIIWLLSKNSPLYLQSQWQFKRQRILLSRHEKRFKNSKSKLNLVVLMKCLNQH